MLVRDTSSQNNVQKRYPIKTARGNRDFRAKTCIACHEQANRSEV